MGELGIVLDDAAIKRLLDSSRRGDQQPVERLTAALEEGAALDVLLAQSLDRTVSEIESFFLKGGATLRELGNVKQRAHVAIAQCEPSERVGWTAVYFTTIASALVYHGNLISNRPANLVISTLLCLTDVDDARWATLFQEAAEAVDAADRDAPREQD